MNNLLLEVIPWNGSGLELTPEVVRSTRIPKDFFTSNGEIIYGDNNTFAIDIKFKAKQPGFVVQHIKKQIYDRDKQIMVEDIEYWEIFYISPKNKHVDPSDRSVYYLSENADSYKYGGNEEDLLENATYVQTGICEFYPYDNSDGAVKFDEDGGMLSSPKLLEIFGDKVVFGDIETPANGLPYSKTKIIVNGLSVSGPTLKRVVSGEWNDHKNEVVELKEEFQYLDPSDGIIKGPWSLKRFDYLTDLSDKQRLMMANKLYKFIDINKAFDIDDDDTELDIANKLFDYLTANQFGEKKKGGKKTNRTKKYKKKYKKKSVKKSKKKRKRVKSRKKKV
jgi:hypothetical protein